MDNQHTEILKALRKAGLNGVPNYYFPTRLRIMSYTKRLSELRQEGYNIQKERQYFKNGKATGVYNYYLLEN